MALPVTIRTLDPHADAEIELVAQRMRLTLIEVEGPEVGGALYSIEWLRDRVRWHLDPDKAVAQVFLATDGAGAILGHTIVRKEHTPTGDTYGLFSTTYVVPEARRLGVAELLVLQGEAWLCAQGLRVLSTWTSATNVKLIRLFEKQGYALVAEHCHETTQTKMVQLEKDFG